MHAQRLMATPLFAVILLFWAVPADIAAQTVQLEGVVVGEDEGRPLRGATVSLVELGRETRTDAAGRFVFREVPVGSHTLQVQHAGFAVQEPVVDVRPGAAPVEIRLAARPFEIAGVVATGTPLRGAAPHQPSQAYDRDAIARRMGTSIGEMLDGEPGVGMRSMGSVTARPVIRGLDGDRVAVLENGQAMGDMSETAPDHPVSFDPLTADRIEVVRGPASLLYGSSALGGVVNLLREDIPRSWRPGLAGTAATHGATVNRLGAGSTALVYGADRWAATGRFAVRGSDDFRTPGTTSGVLESTHARSLSGAAGFGWQGERFRGGASLDLYRHSFGIPDELDDPDAEVEIRSARQRVTGLAEWSGAGPFRQLELRTSAARYFQQEVEMELEPDGRIGEDVEHEFTRHTADATLTARHGGLVRASRGAVGAAVTVQTLAASGADEFHPDGQRLSAALFLFEEVKLSEWLSLQLGGRGEAERTSARENEHFPGFSATRDAFTFSGSVGLGFRPAEAIEIGAHLARAHRAPLIEELYADGPHLGAARYEIGDPELRNEIGHGADLFVRLHGRRSEVEVVGFVNHIDHFVFAQATDETDARTDLPIVRWSAVPARFVGGEVALQTQLTQALSLRATGDYVRGSRRGADGAPLPFVPPARLTLSTRYDAGRFWTGARTRLVAAQERVHLKDPTEGYALLDVHAGLRLGRHRDHLLVLRVDNALDTVYRDHLSRVEERRFPMPGRNLNLVYRFSF